MAKKNLLSSHWDANDELLMLIRKYAGNKQGYRYAYKKKVDGGFEVGVLKNKSEAKNLLNQIKIPTNRDEVWVYNYNDWTTYPSISEAKQAYKRFMRGSEGAERDRYTNIYFQLDDGNRIVSDEVNY